ncbi:hypothetical protein LJC16_00590 [Bacteroidales bacterium OttesenSCG-928-C19]|nr:hypothetical protein [Bacteroidales bacterium OttesenSCG-928-C19]
MKQAKKILSIVVLMFVLLSTTGIRAAVHECLHHLSDHHSSISLPFSSVEDLCTHHESNNSCCSHTHEGHASDGVCNEHSECCCGTEVSFAQLEIDAFESNESSFDEDIFLSIISVVIPIELRIPLQGNNLFDTESWEHTIPLLQNNQLSFLSQYRI